MQKTNVCTKKAHLTALQLPNTMNQRLDGKCQATTCRTTTTGSRTYYDISKINASKNLRNLSFFRIFIITATYFLKKCYTYTMFFAKAKPILSGMRTCIALVLFATLRSLSYPQETSVSGLYRYTLDNGLELYVMENAAAPLAYIEIAVRAGGIAQTKENCGLFHLYEHMMFKGNERYPTAQAVTDALTHMGVTDWNGSTAVDYVNYYFTVPSDLLEEGLEFWSYAIRTPNLDSAEFEREKDVVIAEIQGNYSQPGDIAYSAVAKRLYPQEPWHLDPGGTVQAVRAATVQQLLDIKNAYYVPNNSALFVGGSVHHEDVYQKVNAIYGTWQKSSAEIPAPFLPARNPVQETTYLVYPNPGMSPALTQVSVYMRGPDAETDAQDTYAADVWGTLISNPDGAFKKSLLRDERLDIPAPEYVAAYYYTQRASGRISFYALLLNAQNAAESARYAAEEAFPSAIDEMISGKRYFSAKELALAKKRMGTERRVAQETAEGFLGNLRFWWASADADYFLSYQAHVDAVDKRQIDAFLRKYVQDKKPVVMVQVSPQVYEAQKESFAEAGFSVVTQENAFWWSEL